MINNDIRCYDRSNNIDINREQKKSFNANDKSPDKTNIRNNESDCIINSKVLNFPQPKNLQNFEKYKSLNERLTRLSNILERTIIESKATRKASRKESKMINNNNNTHLNKITNRIKKNSDKLKLLQYLKSLVEANMYSYTVPKYEKLTIEATYNYLTFNYFIRIYQLFFMLISLVSIKTIQNYCEFNNENYDEYFHQYYNNKDRFNLTVFEELYDYKLNSKQLNDIYSIIEIIFSYKTTANSNFVFIKPSVFDLLLSIFLLLIIILFPVALLKNLRKRKNNLLAPQFIIKYGSLYINFRTITKDIFSILVLIFFFSVVCLINFFKYFGNVQLIAFLVLYVIKIIFISRIMPFTKSIKVMYESLSEVLVLLLLCCSMLIVLYESLIDNKIMRWISVCLFFSIIILRSIRLAVDLIFRFISLYKIEIVNNISEKDIENEIVNEMEHFGINGFDERTSTLKVLPDGISNNIRNSQLRGEFTKRKRHNSENMKRKFIELTNKNYKLKDSNIEVKNKKENEKKYWSENNKKNEHKAPYNHDRSEFKDNSDVNIHHDNMSSSIEDSVSDNNNNSLNISPNFDNNDMDDSNRELK